jgi:hypothetical protein
MVDGIDDMCTHRMYSGTWLEGLDSRLIGFIFFGEHEDESVDEIYLRHTSG